MKKLAINILTLIMIVASHSVFAQGAKKDIVGIATSNNDFSTLVAALKAGGLVEALKGKGPFTVFAPNNDAFSKIDSKTLNTLLKPENKQQLASILTYHVVSGKITASAVAKALKDGNGKAELTTLNGSKLKAVKKNGGIWLVDQNGNYSKILSTDVMAKNGVIHVIGSVVMP